MTQVYNYTVHIIINYDKVLYQLTPLKIPMSTIPDGKEQWKTAKKQWFSCILLSLDSVGQICKLYNKFVLHLINQVWNNSLSTETMSNQNRSFTCPVKSMPCLSFWVRNKVWPVKTNLAGHHDLWLTGHNIPSAVNVKICCSLSNSITTKMLTMFRYVWNGDRQWGSWKQQSQTET